MVFFETKLHACILRLNYSFFPHIPRLQYRHGPEILPLGHVGEDHCLHVGCVGSTTFIAIRLAYLSFQVFPTKNYVFSSPTTYLALHPLPPVIVSVLVYINKLHKRGHYMWWHLHVNIFHYFKMPYITCRFFSAKFMNNGYNGPYYHRKLFPRFLLVPPPHPLWPPHFVTPWH